MSDITNEFRYYKCTQPFEVEPVDDDGMFLDSMPSILIKVGTVWEIEFRNGEPTWIAHQIDGYGRLMDISKKDWESKEFFERLSNNYYKELE